MIHFRKLLRKFPQTIENILSGRFINVLYFAVLLVITWIGNRVFTPAIEATSDESEEGISDHDQEESEEAENVQNPVSRSSCKILLNEIFIGNGEENSMQFIELARHCPKPMLQTKKGLGLDGYVIMSVQLGNPAKVFFIAQLSNEKLIPVQGTDELDGSEREHFLHVTGTPNTPAKSLTITIRELLRYKKVQFRSQPDLTKVFPNAADVNDPVAFFLLYFKENERTVPPLTQIHLDFWKDRFTDSIKYFDFEIKPAQIECITNRIMDYVIIGKEVKDDAEKFMRTVLSNQELDLSQHLIKQSSEEDKSLMSYSRCGTTAMDHTAFDLQEPTPLAPNTCKYVAPYKFHGHPLKTDGQKIALNVLNFLRQYKDRLGDLTWSPIEMASKFLGIGRKLLRRVEQRHSVNAIQTPGKKRKMPNWKQQKVDSFDRDVIRSIIARFY